MKKVNIIITTLCLAALASCKIGGLEMQKDFQYVSGSELHGEINKTASQYLQDRGKTPNIPNDTVFKYMQMGLEYAGIDLAEYTKPGRTYIFLSNNSIRVLPTTTVTVNGKPVVTTTSNVPTGGFWFDFPIMDKNPDGTQKFAADGVTPITHPAKAWSDYTVATVRNYFLYLIGQGDVGFNNANYSNTGLASLLPAGAVAGKESRMGYLIVNTTPMLNASGARVLVYNYTTGGNGFDYEGKFNIKIGSGDFTPMIVNDNTTVTTGGLIATNGQIHVCSTTVYPSRY